MLKNINQDLVDSLQSLPYFEASHIDHILPLEGGYSHEVYRVESTSIQGRKSTSVAKRVSGRSTRATEAKATKVAFEQGIGAELLYANEHWLVTAYFDGVSLNNSKLSIDEKLSVSLKLLSKMHRSFFEHKYLVGYVSLLNVSLVLDQLITSSTRHQNDKDTLRQIATDFSVETGDSQLVYIHGDCNFSNVLVRSEQNYQQGAYLIDFEAVSLAEPEYELGMLLAVNRIDIKHLVRCLHLYHSNVSICADKVTRYSVISCIINGLWYEQQALLNQVDSYQIKAVQQFEFMNSLIEPKYMLTFK
jgi:thiamine kinase-like enzyme